MSSFEPSRKARLTAYLLLTLTTSFWAGNSILARGLHEQIPPVAFALLRWSLATVILLPFAWRHLRRDLPALVSAWPSVLVLAILGVSVFNTLLYQAAHTTTATQIALVQTLMPAVIALLSALLFGERIARLGIVGIAFSMAGAALVILQGSLQRLFQLDFSPGDLWMVVAVVDYALYSVLLRRRPKVHPLSLLGATFVCGTVLLLPVFALEWRRLGAPTLDAPAYGAILYVAVFPSILAYRFWNRGVELIGANRAGFFICLIPVFTAVLAMVFLDERLEWYHPVGLALIAAGFVLFNRPPHSGGSRPRNMPGPD